MANAHDATLAPGAAGNISAHRGERNAAGIDLPEQQFAPTCIVRCEFVRRPRAHELPQRLFELIRWRRFLRKADCLEAHAPYGALGLVTKLTHQAIADRVDAGARIPLGDEALELCAPWMILRRLRVEELENETAPAAEEDGAIIELHTQHVGGSRGLLKARQIITDLARARAKIIVSAGGGLIRAQQRLIARIVDGACVGRPQPPGCGVKEMRMFRRAGPRSPSGQAFGT